MLVEFLAAVLIVCLFAGLALYAIGLLPIPASFVNVSRVIVIIGAILYTVEIFRE